MTALTYGWPDSRIDGPPVWDDPSFAALLAAHPALSAMRRYLPATASDIAFAGQAHIHDLTTSYRLRGYGTLLYALVRALQPRRVIEVGIFEGFSLLSMAAALRDNGRGMIDGYDLFEAYPYRRSKRADVVARVTALQLDPWVTISSMDAYDVELRSVDLLHVDVSNTGDTFRRMFERWSGHVSGAIVFEGGGRERDDVAWMHTYHQPAIGPAIAELELSYPDWGFCVLPPFPSMTIACRRQ